MHRLYEKASALTESLIGAAIEVHRDKGPGLVESIYESCLQCELHLRDLPSTRQKSVKVRYKPFIKEEALRFDLLVDDCVLVEIKTVESILPIHRAQLLSYMNVLDVPLGLVINFNTLRLPSGIARMMLPGANR